MLETTNTDVKTKSPILTWPNVRIVEYSSLLKIKNVRNVTIESPGSIILEKKELS